MEGYAYSYPDSGDSSPRSREIDFDTNPPSSWDIDHQPPPPPPPPTHKVKFMVSYGGKIQPRSHDNQLAYVGGETKILAVDRTVKFSLLLSKLVSLLAEDTTNNNNTNTTTSNTNNNNNNSNLCITSFKYQLPGEDLDALISVTNDDDLEHMMHEYDRLYRASSKPARLRLFAFPNTHTGFSSGNSDKLDRDRFVDSLNAVPVPVPVPVPVQAPDHQPPPVGISNNNMDFLFGLEAKNAPVPVQVPVHSDRGIPDLNRLQISAEQHQMQQLQQNPVGNVVGEVYQTSPPTIPASVQIPANYWQPPPPPQPTVSLDHQPPPVQPPQHQQQQQQHIPRPQSQPVYMIHHAPQPTTVYHAPMARPPPPQGYYQVQRVTSDPVYGIPGPQKVVYSTEGIGGVGVPFRPVAGENTVGGGGGYHVAYDNTTGKQVYYQAPGGGVGLGGGGGTVPFTGDVSRTGQVQVQGHGQGVGLTGSEGKVVQKVSPTSATL